MTFRYITFPQEIIFGAGVLDAISEIAAQKNWERILLVTTHSQTANGNAARLQKLLGDKLTAIFDSTQPHVPQANVDDASNLARAKNIYALIALGGGSAVGVAKAVSHTLVSTSGDTAVPIVAVPTTYAGSEMTPVFGVTRERDGVAKKETTNDTRIVPRVVLYDSLLTLDLPRDLTASTGINAFAHCVEAAYSITQNPVSTLLALEGARLISTALPRCVKNGTDVDARSEMLQGAYLAGASLANVAMGLHHGVCHVLGGTANVPHGIANAIVLPHAMRFNADVCPKELAQIAGAMGIARGDEPAVALDAARQTAMWIKQMGLPSRLRDAGVNQNDLPKLALLAFQNKTVQNNPKKMTSVQEMERFLQAIW